MGLRIRENTKRGGGSSSRSTTSRKAKRTFIVDYDADTPPASLAVVETAEVVDNTDPENPVVTAEIPALGDELPGDADRVVTDISVKPHDDTGLVFDVEVTYETPELEEFNDDDPLTDPVVYEWSFSPSSQTYFKDESEEDDDEPGSPANKPTVTSAGEPFANLLEREVGEITVTVTDNITPEAWDPIAAAQYMKPATAINDAAMTIDGIAIAIGQARFAGCDCGGIQERNGIEYRTRKITLKLAQNWNHVVEDRGLNELDADGVYPWPILDANKTPVTKPYPLDGEGHAQASVTDAPAELTFRPYPKKDFGVWGIT